MAPTTPLEDDDMTMNELWERIRRMAVKIWYRTTRRMRVMIVMVMFLYVLLIICLSTTQPLFVFLSFLILQQVLIISLFSDPSLSVYQVVTYAATMTTSPSQKYHSNTHKSRGHHTTPPKSPSLLKIAPTPSSLRSCCTSCPSYPQTGASASWAPSNPSSSSTNPSPSANK